MAIVLKGGAIFLHVPKTGGNWVAAVLAECGLIQRRLKVPHKHADMDRVVRAIRGPARQALRSSVLRLLGKRAAGPAKLPFMFCFVRHPVTWYESWFKYMSQPACNWREWGGDSRRGHWHPNAVLDGLGDPDFNTFVRNVIRRRPGYVTEMYGWYDRPGIGFVGKQENLTSDLIAVLRWLELDFDEDRIRNMGPVGVSAKPRRPIRWEPGLMAEVERLEYAALVRYGYKPFALNKAA